DGTYEAGSQRSLGVAPHLLATAEHVLVGDREDGRASVNAEKSTAGETRSRLAWQALEDAVAPHLGEFVSGRQRLDPAGAGLCGTGCRCRLEWGVGGRRRSC